jgi:hypothetical protein
MPKKLSSAEAAYLAPIMNRILGNIKSLEARLDRRVIDEWFVSEYAIVASTARQIAEDATFIDSAMGILADIDRGELRD